MTTELEKRLSPYLFPVIEREVFHSDILNKNPIRTRDYKAVVRKDSGELISIMNDTYKIIPNREVIGPLMEQLLGLESPWFIDSSHSFVDNERMRLQITFPELVLHDGRSDVSMSLFLHNSYNGSESVRMMWGAIRAICKNGMVFGTVLSKFYGRHTMNLNVGNLREQVEATYEKIPVIKHRIEQLQNEKVTDTLRQSIEKNLGKKIACYIGEQEEETQRAKNQWVIYNMITYYVSHVIQQRLRSQYQLEVSRLFKL
jgi:ribosomal silencing factor RsfS